MTSHSGFSNEANLLDGSQYEQAQDEHKFANCSNFPQEYQYACEDRSTNTCFDQPQCLETSLEYVQNEMVNYMQAAEYSMIDSNIYGDEMTSILHGFQQEHGFMEP
ncbi:hypothetical protein FKM82_029459 [Ascaphus truei]